MAAKSEPLSWEVLDYWRASGLPFTSPVPGSTVVYRSTTGQVKGFAAIGNRQDTALSFILEPLIADSGPIAVKVIDCLEHWMLERNLPGYVFFVDDGNENYLGVIEKLTAQGVFTRLGKTQSGKAHWYARKF